MASGCKKRHSLEQITGKGTDYPLSGVSGDTGVSLIADLRLFNLKGHIWLFGGSKNSNRTDVPKKEVILR